MTSTKLQKWGWQNQTIIYNQQGFYDKVINRDALYLRSYDIVAKSILLLSQQDVLSSRDC